MKEKFAEDIAQSYTFKGDSIFLGCGFYDHQVDPKARVFLPLKMFNRHGLIAGATGTGKTKTLASNRGAAFQEGSFLFTFGHQRRLKWNRRRRC